MTYTRTNWVNGRGHGAWAPGATGVSAERLNNIEAGIASLDTGDAGGSVKAAPYNATGDGVTDDTAAVHARRDAAGVSGIVYFPAGTYLVSGLVANVVGQKWVLHPAATIKLVASAAANTRTVRILAAKVTIAGGVVDGNRANQVNTFINGIEYAADDVTVDGVTVQNVVYRGIYGKNCNRGRVKWNTVTGTGELAIFVEADSTATADIYDHKITNNTVDRTSEGSASFFIEGGISVHGSHTSNFFAYDTQILGNTVNMPVMAYDAAGTSSVGCIGAQYRADRTIIANNTCRGSVIAISVAGGGVAGYGSQGCVVASNTVFNFSTLGIEWAGSPHGTCTGNVVDGNNLGYVGIAQTNAGSLSMAIAANTIRRCAQDGMLLGAGSEFTAVAGNAVSIAASGRFGISADSDNTAINGNTIASSSAETESWGIYTRADRSHITISGNVLDGNDIAKIGIHSYRPLLGLTETGNAIHNFTQNGTLVSASSAVTIDAGAALGNTYQPASAGFATSFSGAAALGQRFLIGDSERGFSLRRLAQAGNYTITATDPDYIGITSTAAARTVTLPAASAVSAGRTFVVKDESGAAATNNITVQRAGSDTIDGATTKVINTNYGSARLYSDGASKWFSV